MVEDKKNGLVKGEYVGYRRVGTRVGIHPRESWVDGVVYLQHE